MTNTFDSLINASAYLLSDVEDLTLGNSEYFRAQVELIADTAGVWPDQDSDVRKENIADAIRERIIELRQEATRSSFERFVDKVNAQLDEYAVGDAMPDVTPWLNEAYRLGRENA